MKAEVGVGQGKDAHDKRADLKKRAVDRETAREVARFNRKHGIDCLSNDGLPAATLAILHGRLLRTFRI